MTSLICKICKCVNMYREEVLREGACFQYKTIVKIYARNKVSSLQVLGAPAVPIVRDELVLPID